MAPRLLLLALLVCLALVSVSAGRHNRTQRLEQLEPEPLGANACNGKDFGTAGQFDFYVYEQTWSAEFCFMHKDWPGCKQPTAYMRQNLTLHGLWPNYATPRSGNNWPQCCPSAFGTDVDPNVVKTLLPDLQKYWPNEQDPTGNDLKNSLWQHEWQKHGTCSGLPQKAYFSNAMDMEISMPTPSAITANIGGSVALTELQAAFKSTGCTNGGACWTGFVCDRSAGKEFLAAIVTCWSQQLQRITCPASVLNRNNCAQAQIMIAKFQ